MTRRPHNDYPAYHAHVYFTPDALAFATALLHRIAQAFAVKIGRAHLRPIGPHPHCSCQVSFEAATFDALIAWLEAERGPLNVLVHGLTGDALADHTTHASWLGDASPLKLSVFSSRPARRARHSPDSLAAP